MPMFSIRRRRATSAIFWPVPRTAAISILIAWRSPAARLPRFAQSLRDYVAGKTVPRVQKAKSAEKSRKLALVYSGNGPQWWGMGRELLAESTKFRAEIEKIDRIFTKLAGWSLVDEMSKPEAECRIGLTEIAQPLLFAQQVALTELLKSAGVVPDAVFGHSVGRSGCSLRERCAQPRAGL